MEENDDDGVSYYDEEADASDSDSGSSDVTPVAAIERRKSKYLEKREQKAPYSKIYQLKLKLSKWLEPSCTLAKIPLLQQNQQPEQYCYDSALKFASKGLMESS